MSCAYGVISSDKSSCACSTGYSGGGAWIASSASYPTCSAVSCPNGAISGDKSSCACNTGYSGGGAWIASSVSYPACTAVSCAYGVISSDKSSCTCNTGYHGGGAWIASSASYATCTPWSKCPAGQGVSVAGSATSDVTCAPCTLGSTYSSVSSSTEACEPVGDCAQGQYEVLVPTLVKPRDCASHNPCTETQYTHADATHPDPSVPTQGTDYDCRPAGSCANGALISLAERTQANHCGSCNTGYKLVGTSCVEVQCGNGDIAGDKSSCVCRPGYVGGGAWKSASASYPVCSEASCGNGVTSDAGSTSASCACDMGYSGGGAWSSVALAYPACLPVSCPNGSVAADRSTCSLRGGTPSVAPTAA